MTHLNPRHKLCKYEPDVDHLDVRSLWQAVRHTESFPININFIQSIANLFKRPDEECREDEEGGEVDGDYCLKCLCPLENP